MFNAFSNRIAHVDLEQWRSVYLRALSLLLIVLGLYRWGEIVGMFAVEEGVGFSELSGAWQAAIINLAVAFPVAATGLWLLARWGLVLWIYAAASEIAMHTLFAGVFGFQLIPIAGHLALFAIYAGTVWLGGRVHADKERAERANRQIAPQDRPVGTGRFTAGARAKIAATLARARPGGAAAEAADAAPASDNPG